MRTVLTAILFVLPSVAGSKPMTPLDVMHFKTVAAGTLSKDGKWFAYTIASLDWKQGKRYTDVWLTDTISGTTPVHLHRREE